MALEIENVKKEYEEKQRKKKEKEEKEKKDKKDKDDKKEDDKDKKKKEEAKDEEKEKNDQVLFSHRSDIFSCFGIDINNEQIDAIKKEAESKPDDSPRIFSLHKYVRRAKSHLADGD